MEPILILQFAKSEVSINPDPSVSVCNECIQNPKIKIDLDDILFLNIRNSALICYVVGVLTISSCNLLSFFYLILLAF